MIIDFITVLVFSQNKDGEFPLIIKQIRTRLIALSY